MSPGAGPAASAAAAKAAAKAAQYGERWVEVGVPQALGSQGEAPLMCRVPDLPPGAVRGIVSQGPAHTLAPLCPPRPRELRLHPGPRMKTPLSADSPTSPTSRI